MRIPGRSDPRAEAAIERIVGILSTFADVPYQGKTHVGVKHLALQSSGLALVQVGLVSIG